MFSTYLVVSHSHVLMGQTGGIGLVSPPSQLYLWCLVPAETCKNSYFNMKPTTKCDTLLKMRLSSHRSESVLIFFLILGLYFALKFVMTTHTVGLVLYMLSSRLQEPCSSTIVGAHRKRCRKSQRDHFSGSKLHVSRFAKLRLTCNPTHVI